MCSVCPVFALGLQEEQCWNSYVKWSENENLAMLAIFPMYQHFKKLNRSPQKCFNLSLALLIASSEQLPRQYSSDLNDTFGHVGSVSCMVGVGNMPYHSPASCTIQPGSANVFSLLSFRPRATGGAVLKQRCKMVWKWNFGHVGNISHV